MEGFFYLGIHMECFRSIHLSLLFQILNFLFVPKQFSPDEFSYRGFSYGAMFIVGTFMGKKIPGQSSGEYFQGVNFIEPFSKSFSNSANLSTQSKHIQHYNYKLFNLAQIIHLSTNHSTLYKSFNALKIVKKSCGIYKHQSTVEN